MAVYKTLVLAIQDLGACGTVVQLGDLDIEGGANSEAAGV